jgi:hypothetical protein
MSIEFPEPKTEDEAQRIKRFLEGGAQVAVTEVQAFTADGSSRATLADPGTFKVSTSGEQVLRLVGAGDRRATIVVDFSDIKTPDQVWAALFLNKPDASARTPLDDPALIATLGFFIHSQDHMGPSEKDADALRYEFDITPALKRLQRPSDGLTISVVLLPLAKAPSTSVGVAIRRVSVRVVESSVKRAT